LKIGSKELDNVWVTQFSGRKMYEISFNTQVELALKMVGTMRKLYKEYLKEDQLS